MRTTTTTSRPVGEVCGPVQTMVCLREIRETAYRSLVVAGASTGEATTAAEQVLHAEIHHGTGLSALADDLGSGPWRVRTARTVFSRDAGTVVARVDCAGHALPLRHGARLVDLLASLATSATPALVACADAEPVGVLLDGLLVNAATDLGLGVVALQVEDNGTTTAARAATASAEVGAAIPALDAAEREMVRHALPHGGLALLGSSRAQAPAGPDIEAVARRRRRQELASTRVAVDADLWRRVYTAAQAYLVPES